MPGVLLIKLSLPMLLRRNRLLNNLLPKPLCNLFRARGQIHFASARRVVCALRGNHGNCWTLFTAVREALGMDIGPSEAEPF